MTQTTKKTQTDWKKTTLGENLSDIAMGPFGSNLKVEMFTSEGVPIIRGKNLNKNYVTGKFVYVAEEKADSLRRSVAYPGDIIITHRGTLGQVSLVPENEFPRYVASQSQLRFTVDPEKIFNKYLLYFLKSKLGQYELLLNKSQVGVPAIANPTKSIKAINLFLPPLPEQHAIANVLCAFDDKITLLRRQNKMLEAVAQAIFKEWFVHFNFLNDRGKPYKASGGKMMESELGEIPEGWRVGRLGDEFEITMGQSPKGESYNENKDGMIFFQGRAEFQERFPKIRLYTTDPKRIAEKFDVLVSVRAPVGDINMAFDRCCIGRGLSAVRSDCKSYTFYKMKSLKSIFDKFEADGTVFGSINKNDFTNIEAIIPETEYVKKFENVVNPIDQKIYNNYNQIQTFTYLRDTLLPKLMSGEVRVEN